MCGQAASAALNGFFSFWNYNILGEGPHTVTVRTETLTGSSTKVVEDLGPVSFEVVTLGGEFLVGLPTPLWTVDNWPAQGDRTQMQWNQASQNCTIVGRGEDNASGEWVMELTQTPNSASGNPPGQTPIPCDPPIHMSMDSLRAVVDLEQETTAQMMAGLSGNLHLSPPRQDAQMTTELTGNYMYDPAGGPMDGDFSLNTQPPAFYDLGAPLLDMFGTGCVARAGFEANGNILEETVSGAQLSITYDDCMPEVFKTNCYIQYSGTITPGTEPAPECDTSADCGEGFICASDQTCLEVPPCTTDMECGDGFMCTDGTCVAAPPPCTTDLECGDGFLCTDGMCVAAPPECTTDLECGDGMLCTDGMCGPIPCTQDADCPDTDPDTEAGFQCIADTCVPRGCFPPGCPAGFLCIDPGFPLCWPEELVCFTDLDCDEGFECLGMTCREVTPPECTTDLDCGEGMLCTDETCVAAPPLCTDVVCPTGEVCNDASGLCGPIPCTQDADCPDTGGFFCDIGFQNICVTAIL